MTDAENVVYWKGSQQDYKYWFLPISHSNWKSEPGNYIFAQRLGANWKAIYVGQTGDGPNGTLKVRLSGHEKMQAALRLGATHIHAHTNHNTVNRRNEEDDLKALNAPPLNVR